VLSEEVYELFGERKFIVFRNCVWMKRSARMLPFPDAMKKAILRSIIVDDDLYDDSGTLALLPKIESFEEIKRYPYCRAFVYKINNRSLKSLNIRTLRDFCENLSGDTVYIFLPEYVLTAGKVRKNARNYMTKVAPWNPHVHFIFYRSPPGLIKVWDKHLVKEVDLMSRFGRTAGEIASYIFVRFKHKVTAFTVQLKIWMLKILKRSSNVHRTKHAIENWIRRFYNSVKASVKWCGTYRLALNRIRKKNSERF
jgi:hypothetical protein